MAYSFFCYKRSEASREREAIPSSKIPANWAQGPGFWFCWWCCKALGEHGPAGSDCPYCHRPLEY